MVLVEALEWLGLSGSIIMVASAGFALYHGYELMGFAAAAGTYLRVAGLLGFVLVLALSGLIPGVEVDIALDVVAEMFNGVWEIISNGISVTVGSVV